MKIILKKKNGKYGFEIVTEDAKTVYASSKQHFLVPFVKPNYDYAWEACHDAWRIANKAPYHVSPLLRTALEDMESPVTTDVSADAMITDHYLSIWRDLRIKSKGAKGKEDREKTYKEVAMVIKEIETVLEQLEEPVEKNKLTKVLRRFHMLVQKYFAREKAEEKNNPPAPPAPPMPPMGQPKMATRIAKAMSPEAEEALPPELVEDALDSFAVKICLAVQEKHNDAYYTVDQDSKEITILDFSNDPILKAKVNDNLSVESVIPVGKLNKIYPVHSVEFYQKYWKPITESIGHFYLSNSDILLKIDEMTLPDVPTKNKSFTVEGWKCQNRESAIVDISFKGEKPIWIVETGKQVRTAAGTIKQEYLNAKVQCIDPKLKSLYGKEGIVRQTIPMSDMVLVEVVFPEGLGTVRLKESQIKIIPLGA